jgi:hypothetical protein
MVAMVSALMRGLPSRLGVCRDTKSDFSKSSFNSTYFMLSHSSEGILYTS